MESATWLVVGAMVITYCARLDALHSVLLCSAIIAVAVSIIELIKDN